MSTLRSALDSGRFACVIEFTGLCSAQRLAQAQALVAHQALGAWPLVPALADRVGHAYSATPSHAVQQLAPSALVHFSGKDRERSDLLQQLAQYAALGIDQMLVISGDRLPGHQPGQFPVRYLESVPALAIARQEQPGWLLGAALNPFKYAEEDSAAQYLKAAKKLAAGADFLALQLGYDPLKHRLALRWMAQQVQPKPLLACVMGLTYARARALQHMPGVVISPSVMATLELEHSASAEEQQARSTSRLALQMVGLELMGYAGVHLSGIHNVEQLDALALSIGGWRLVLTCVDDWQDAWQQAWRRADGEPTCFELPTAPHANASARWREWAHYHLLHRVHEQLFSRTTLASRAFGWAVQRPAWATPTGKRWLQQLERALKRRLVGCDTCGQCRLEDTLYTCPETCPKGLANGPCGGTQLNRCEFGDRECIHSANYRRAKAVGQMARLKERLIPCVETATRQRSSWPAWFSPPTDHRRNTEHRDE